MSIQRLRDLREYYVMETDVDMTTGSGIKSYVGVPSSGWVTRACIVTQAAHAGTDTIVSFSTPNGAMKAGGIGANITLLTSGAAIGRSHVGLPS
jgi:hypothetical protein